MATTNWTLTAGGSWAQDLAWSTNHHPVAGDTANINNVFAGAAYDVDVTDDESVGVVNIGAANAELAVEGATFTANTINLNAGTLAIVGGGVVTGATIVAATGTTFRAQDGTLAGNTTWRGPLVLNSVTQAPLLTVTGSLTLLNASGTGSGELDVTSGGGTEIDFSTMTLDGQSSGPALQFTILNPSSGSAVLGVSHNSTLTLGSHTHLDLAGSDVQIRDVDSGGTLVNNGSITAEASTVEVSVDSFVNNSLVSVNGSNFRILGTLSGNGTINVQFGGTLELDGPVGSGTIAFDGGTLKLDNPTLPTASISNFAAGDVIDLVLHPYNGRDGVSLLAGNVLDLTPAGGGTNIHLQLASTENFSGRRLALSPGAFGETVVTVASTVNVATPGGIDLRWATLYDELANSPIQSGGTATQYIAADTGAFNGHTAAIKFVVTGNGFTYGGTPPNAFLTGGTITGVQIQSTNGVELAEFAGLSIRAIVFQSAMNNYIGSADASGLNAIFLTNNYVVTGGSGADKFQGGSLFDDFIANVGNDVVDGGPGTNTVDYSALPPTGVVAIIQGGAGIVNKGGTHGNDTLTNARNIIGTTASDVFYVDSAETITGGGAFDYLIELSASVNLTYGVNFTGISEFVSNTGTNGVDFSSDTNFAFIYGSTGRDALTLGSGGGYLFSGGGTLNLLTGGINATNFFVENGDNTSTSTMLGGIGTATNYFYVEGNVNDTVHGSGAFNTVIQLTAGVSIQLGGSNFTKIDEYVANSGTNTVTVNMGDTGFKYLYGGAGNDTLSTGSGGGYLFGEGGINTLTGGGGTNVFVADGSTGVDTMNGGGGSNLYYIDANSIVHGAGTFNNVIELQQNVSLTLGSAQLGTNVQQVILNGGTNSVDFHTAMTQVFLYGASGNDTLFGGAGSDFLYGAGGTNTFKFASGWGKDTIEDWTSGTNDIIDLTGLSSLGVHAITDITQTIAGGKDVITSSHTGTNSITLLGVGSALTASSFHFM